jgi:hypothetical protein
MAVDSVTAMDAPAAAQRVCCTPPLRETRMTVRTVALFVALTALAAAAGAQDRKPPYDGFLCCNMLNDRGWINDINYRDDRKQLLPAGTPVKVTGTGRYRLKITVDGKKLELGNDYSRAVGMEDFARRYILAEDPSRLVAGYPAKVREAIAASRVMRGMTREQVLMALGYPPAHYTPDLEAPLWKYWADSGSEFQVFWGNDGRVDQIFGTPAVRARVALE